ncbi:MAG TPA: TIM barrel protein [Candidatus Aquilonibacter sp.]|nr:TIM barrel protein [Candidatus Aquilonibacter sp.]
MDRRDFIGLTGAAIAAASLPRPTFAQGEANTTATPTPGKLRLDAYSRTLHWLRTPSEVAEACHQIGNTSIDLTVRPGSGHVDPAKVTTDLPIFVKGLRAGGIEVSMIAPNITEADDQYAEATLDAASSLGIHHYWWGTFRYEEGKPYWPQLDALKPKVDKIAKLNEKYGMKGMAHPRDGATSVSGVFFDLLYVLKDFDPRWVSFQYDTHHLLQAFDSGWVEQLRLGTPYIGGFVWKDVMIEPASSPNPDDAWRAGHPRPAAGPADGAGMGAFGGAGRGRGRGGFGFGPGRGGNPNAPTKTRIRQVPVGTGMVNLALVADTLKEIGFNGPMECEPEWPQLGGADQGAMELSIPREQAIALLKRDYDTMMGIMATAGLV